ncbi:transposase [Rhizobium mongolense]|uniref:Transposase n=1 Tax=Rhizobium mongolense TaxID=57676 RepID=A0A7W6WDU9_9HYPH|nr:transposase [Rhizobium mongolense]
MFIGYLFGIRSERQLVREIEVNVAYRWFLQMKLTEGVFDASTLSQNRRRRFNDTSVAQDIFDHIVEQRSLMAWWMARCFTRIQRI